MNGTTTVSLGLQELLVSLAESLNLAQRELREMPPADEYGRPNVLYHLPYLDFELHVEFHTSRHNIIPPDVTKSTAQPIKGAVGHSANRLIFTPVAGVSLQRTAGEKHNQKYSSRIAGRFVAALPNDGLPPLRMLFTAEKITTTTEGTSTYKLTVTVLYPDGKPVPGKRVEINFDQYTTQQLNNNKKLTSPPLLSPSAMGFTDERGNFSTNVTISSADTNKNIVFVAYCEKLESSISLS